MLRMTTDVIALWMTTEVMGHSAVDDDRCIMLWMTTEVTGHSTVDGDRKHSAVDDDRIDGA